MIKWPFISHCSNGLICSLRKLKGKHAELTTGKYCHQCEITQLIKSTQKKNYKKALGEDMLAVIKPSWCRQQMGLGSPPIYLSNSLINTYA